LVQSALLALVDLDLRFLHVPLEILVVPVVQDCLPDPLVQLGQLELVKIGMDLELDLYHLHLVKLPVD
jgi:hypothetical protein